MDGRDPGGADWLSLSSTGGTLQALVNNTTDVIVTVNSNANSLAVGTHTELVYFRDRTNGVTSQRLVTLQVQDPINGFLQVTGNTGLTSVGPVGGGFSPGGITYTLSNPGGQAIIWSGDTDPGQTWLALSSSSGTLEPGASVVITAVITADAFGLGAATYSTTVRFFNQTNDIGNTTRPMQLVISEGPGLLVVTGATGTNASGPVGGPFTVTGESYTLSNAGGEPLDWSAGIVGTPVWATLSATGGTLQPGDTVNVSVTFTAQAALQSAYIYTDTINFADQTADTYTTRGLALNVQPRTPGYLTVTPTAVLDASGPVGGTFSPAFIDYSLSNTGGTTISWSVTKDVSWASLSSSAGHLQPGASTTVRVLINTSANTLSANVYTGTLSFVEPANSFGDTTRLVRVSIGQTAAVFNVTPATDFTTSGIAGGPFSPTSQSYTVSNVGGAGLTWSASLESAPLGWR